YFPVGFQFGIGCNEVVEHNRVLGYLAGSDQFLKLVPRGHYNLVSLPVSYLKAVKEVQTGFLFDFLKQVYGFVSGTASGRRNRVTDDPDEAPLVPDFCLGGYSPAMRLPIGRE